jgi:hypothetical protein
MSAKNRKKKSKKNDFYVTPTAVIEDFYKQTKNELWRWCNLETILDPCAGTGQFKRALMPYLPDSRWTQIDIAPKSSDIMSFDFLTTQHPGRIFDLCISNPPYTLADQFVEQALSVSHKVIFLLRLNFLGSQKRDAFFKTYMPVYIYVIPQRPSFLEGGNDATEYAWFVWDAHTTYKQASIKRLELSNGL